MHPQLLAHFQQGNFVDSINEQIESGSRYDVILLANVIEHVATPGKLLASIKNIMRPKSILIIVAPNDFSVLHEDLLKKKIISKKFWLCYPDHLSYFNKESMTKFLAGLGFNLEAIVADNPIDLNLLNENSNYVREPDKAKKTHMFRVRADNFLGSVDLEKLLRIYEILGSMGIGRDLNYYCTKTI
jgi:2-polyprenyl-3-methyl-5-hydroxy-6-metoxy-1,4-benzoquinol methylase